MPEYTACFIVHELSVNHIEHTVSFQHNGHGYCWKYNQNSWHSMSHRHSVLEVVVPDDVRHFGTFTPGQVVRLTNAPPPGVIDDGGW